MGSPAGGCIKIPPCSGNGGGFRIVFIKKRDAKYRNHLCGHVVIDPHYELKHSATISDDLILELVGLLDGGDFTPEVVNNEFEYYATENLTLNGKRYRLVWLLEKDQLYIGIINAYRRK